MEEGIHAELERTANFAGQGPIYKVVTKGETRGNKFITTGRPLAGGPLLAFARREYAAHHTPRLREARHEHVQPRHVERLLPCLWGRGGDCQQWLKTAMDKNLKWRMFRILYGRPKGPKAWLHAGALMRHHVFEQSEAMPCFRAMRLPIELHTDDLHGTGPDDEILWFVGSGAHGEAPGVAVGCSYTRLRRHRELLAGGMIIRAGEKHTDNVLRLPQLGSAATEGR